MSRNVLAQVFVHTVLLLPLSKGLLIAESLPASQQHFESAESLGTVRLVPPPGWQMADTKTLPKNVRLMVVGKGKGQFPPSINLATENYNGTLKDYLKLVKSINAAKGVEWKDLGKIQTEAGEGSLSQIDTKLQWGDVKMLHTILVRKGVVYIVTVAALKEEFPSLYQPFFNSMRSLTIDEDGVLPMKEDILFFSK